MRLAPSPVDHNDDDEEQSKREKSNENSPPLPSLILDQPPAKSLP